jgi:hypothetical protein
VEQPGFRKTKLLQITGFVGNDKIEAGQKFSKAALTTLVNLAFQTIDRDQSMSTPRRDRLLNLGQAKLPVVP